MNLNQKVTTFFTENNLATKEHKVLVAVSGGIDSMVLLHLLHNLNLTLLVAHVNFTLRGNQSNNDALFVKKICKKLNIPILTTSFNTKEYAKTNKLSIQEAARNLRYNWFMQIAANNNCKYICTAHHANDVAESILINFTRGTGIEGLIGIKAINQKIIRPLINVSKTEIEEFAANKKIHYVEDASNITTKYTRNKIRHKVIPVLEKINPAFINNIANFTHTVEAQNFYYKKAIINIKDSLVSTNNGQTFIKGNELLKLAFAENILFELLKNFEFNYAQCIQIIQSLKTKNTGKYFYTSNYKLLINRNNILVEPITIPNAVEALVNKWDNTIEFTNHTISFDRVKPKDVNYKAENTLYISADKIKLPLVIRNIINGDKFKPLGLKGYKKVSDFLIDKKVDRITKSKCLILTNKKEVVALIPYQISELYKLTDNTKSIVKITTNKKGIW